MPDGAFQRDGQIKGLAPLGSSVERQVVECPLAEIHPPVTGIGHTQAVAELAGDQPHGMGILGVERRRIGQPDRSLGAPSATRVQAWTSVLNQTRLDPALGRDQMVAAEATARRAVVGLEIPILHQLRIKPAVAGMVDFLEEDAVHAGIDRHPWSTGVDLDARLAFAPGGFAGPGTIQETEARKRHEARTQEVTMKP